ncbi:MAG TPA: mechanosensitive ion channel [Burkholderiales bacterium]|nr:mechanosensitive ion channel [Burkholderiales bacterium]
MDFSVLATSLQSTLGSQLPGIFGALGIIVVGWLVAVVARAGARRLLHMLKVDVRIEESTGQQVGVESGISAGVFWLIILVMLVAVFDSLHLESISNPFAQLVTQIVSYAPRLVAGTILVLIAWLIATLIQAVVNRALSASTFGERLSKEAGMEPMSKTVANVLFWLVILLFVPSILAAFDLRGLLEPVQAMLSKFLDIVPNVFGAAVIGFVGWLVARVMRGLVTNLLAAAGADRMGSQIGLAETVKLSRLAGTIVFIFVFVPTLIAALDALRIDAISRPATEMLERLLQAVPNLVAAALILMVTWYVAKFASDVLARLLAGMGIDTLPQRLGISGAFSGTLKPSGLIRGLVLFFAMLFAAVEAAHRLDFTQVRDLVSMFIKFGGEVLLGGSILVIGFWLANLAFDALSRASGDKRPWLARIARVAILGLVIAMGLRAMGIADDIVNLAFGLTLGSVAVAFALAFGLGGREAAGRQMEHWLSQLRKD